MIMDLSKGGWEERIARLERTIQQLILANNKHAEAISMLLSALDTAINEQTKGNDNGTNNKGEK